MQAFGAWNANQQNAQMNTGAWKGDQVAAEAAKLGVSPLAILGGGGSAPTPMQNVAGGAATFGQNLGRAITSQDPAGDKIKKLQAQQLELQNQGLAEDVAAKQLHNSTNAVSLAQPGSPPVPMPPGDDPRYTPGIEPGSTRYRNVDGSIDVTRSRARAESDFSGSVAGMVKATANDLAQEVPGLQTALDFLNSTRNDPRRPQLIRPDWWRSITGGSAGATGSW